MSNQLQNELIWLLLGINTVLPNRINLILDTVDKDIENRKKTRILRLESLGVKRTQSIKT